MLERVIRRCAAIAVLSVVTACGTHVTPPGRPSSAATPPTTAGLAHFSKADSPANSSTEYVGDWGYATRCRMGHYVVVSIAEGADGLVGTWSDGTNSRGSDGSLRATVRGDRALLQRCSTDPAQSGITQCPRFAQADGFLKPRGSSLVWYRMSGTRADEYVELSRGGARPAVDEQCND